MSKPGTTGGERPPHRRMAPIDRIRTDIPTDRSRPTGHVRRPQRAGRPGGSANAMSAHGSRSPRRSAAAVHTVRTSEGSRR